MLLTWGLLHDLALLRSVLGGKKAGKKARTWRIFSLRELHAATNNFNYDNKLGEGGFGSVYWGQLETGDQVLHILFSLHSFLISF